VAEGQIVALIGANGAGKSSTLRAVSGLLRKTGGRVLFRGTEITHEFVRLGLVQVPEGRAIVATISFQENLELGGYTRRDKASLLRDIAAMYERFPILGARRSPPAAQLIGGEQQMLSSRGLLARPRLLLLDEPSLGLAPHYVCEVMGLVRRIRDDGTTIWLTRW
jgi:branched-chain amino acid transport system ATP-binding protein